MSRAERSVGVGASGRGGNVSPVLDTVFGFFVWAVHLVVIYVATAVACQLGLGASAASGLVTFQLVLVGVTLFAMAIVAVHALRRYRQARDDRDARFRLEITAGGDAIAFAAIAWQLFAISLVPLCR